MHSDIVAVGNFDRSAKEENRRRKRGPRRSPFKHATQAGVAPLPCFPPSSTGNPPQALSALGLNYL